MDMLIMTRRRSTAWIERVMNRAAIGGEAWMRLSDQKGAEDVNTSFFSLFSFSFRAFKVPL